MNSQGDSQLSQNGWVLKRGDMLPQWNKRYFVCDPYHCKLLYYKDKPEGELKEDDLPNPRGSMELTDCVISHGDDDKTHTFSVSDAKGRTYNLQVQSKKQVKEWTHALHLLSELGSAKKVVLQDQSNESKPGEVILKLSAEKLLRGFERTANKCRDGLTKVAEQKWRAKCRLQELLKPLNKGQGTLHKKFTDLKKQEKELRQRMHFLNQKEFFLQREVLKSNQLQEKVTAVQNDENRNIKEVIALCCPGDPSNPTRAKHPPGSKPAPTLPEDDEKSSDLLPEPTDFRLEMLKIIVQFFPSCAQHIPSSLKEEVKKPVSTSSPPENKDDELPLTGLTDTEKSLLFYHSYFTRVHVQQEDRLIRIRTQCQGKFHKLKWISKQRDLIQREKAEFGWITTEMKRAINRLNKEGVPLAPGEVEETSGGRNSKIGNNTTDRGDEPVPIRAHRATWSEASDVIFKLNFNRQEQFERTQELEGALKARESMREFVDGLAERN